MNSKKWNVAMVAALALCCAPVGCSGAGASGEPGAASSSDGLTAKANFETPGTLVQSFEESLSGAHSQWDAYLAADRVTFVLKGESGDVRAGASFDFGKHRFFTAASATDTFQSNEIIAAIQRDYASVNASLTSATTGTQSLRLLRETTDDGLDGRRAAWACVGQGLNVVKDFLGDAKDWAFEGLFCIHNSQSGHCTDSIVAEQETTASLAEPASAFAANCSPWK